MLYYINCTQLLLSLVLILFNLCLGITEVIIAFETKIDSRIYNIVMAIGCFRLVITLVGMVSLEYNPFYKTDFNATLIEQVFIDSSIPKLIVQFYAVTTIMNPGDDDRIVLDAVTQLENLLIVESVLF